MNGDNGNLDRYLGLLVDSVNRIERKLDKFKDDHEDHVEKMNGRIRSLEINEARDDERQQTTSRYWGAISGGIMALFGLIAQYFFQSRY